jgi:hypothetical protein
VQSGMEARRVVSFRSRRSAYRRVVLALPAAAQVTRELRLTVLPGVVEIDAIGVRSRAASDPPPGVTRRRPPPSSRDGARTCGGPT